MPSRFFQRFFVVLFDGPSDPGPGGGAPAGAPGSAPPPPAAAPAPAGGTPPAAAGAPAGGGPPAGQPPSYSYPEDRSRWIPPYRLEQLSSRQQALERALQDRDARIRALMGVDAPPNPQHQQIRQSFGEVFPELAPLLEQGGSLQQILELAQSGQLREVLATMNSYWGRHAHTMARDAVDAFARAVGVEPSTLPPRAVARMANQLRQFIEEDETGDRQRRFEMGDPRIVEECIADAQEMWVNPARAALNSNAARQAEANRRLPQGGPAGGVPPQGNQEQRPSRQQIRESARQFVLSNR